jgi:hypothetical protein
MQKAGSPVPQAPAFIQNVKHKHFENTVTLRIEDGCRKGIGWHEAWRRVFWYVVLEGTRQDLNGFVFGK